MNTPEADVLILAAGMGMRLRAISDGLPKALVSVGDKKLLDHALKFAAALAPSGDRIVVGGYRMNLMEQHHDSAESSYTLAHNPEYEMGNLLSVLAGMPHLHRGFYIINADHIFDPSSATKFHNPSQTQVTVFTDSDRILGPDDMKVKINLDGTVKNISKTLTVFDYGYIGVTFIPSACLLTYQQECLRVRDCDPMIATAEKVIQSLSDHNEHVACAVLSDLLWHEVDTPDDYQSAQQYHLKSL